MAIKKVNSLPNQLAARLRRAHQGLNNKKAPPLGGTVWVHLELGAPLGGTVWVHLELGAPTGTVWVQPIAN